MRPGDGRWQAGRPLDREETVAKLLDRMLIFGGAEWLMNPRVLHRVEPLRRIDVVGPHTGWRPVWQAMAGLAEQHGADGVRLVWFTR